MFSSVDWDCTLAYAIFPVISFVLDDYPDDLDCLYVLYGLDFLDVPGCHDDLDAPYQPYFLEDLECLDNL